MLEIKFNTGNLKTAEQNLVTSGFVRNCQKFQAPPLIKEDLYWTACDDKVTVGVLTLEVFWDWGYVDELWVDESRRGQGLGNTLMQAAETYAASRNLIGLWLWTQSWEAAEFYRRLSYQEFTRFEDFPKGHFRVGFRKVF